MTLWDCIRVKKAVVLYIELLCFSHFAKQDRYIKRSDFGREKVVVNEVKVSVMLELV